MSTEPDSLVIGGKYLVPDGTGESVIATLIDASVSEPERAVYGIYKTEDGHCIICFDELTSIEFSRYRENPTWFFGKYKQPQKKLTSAQEWFDFFFDSYKNSSRENLIKWIGSDLPEEAKKLSNLSQHELACIYCSRLAANKSPS